MRYVVASLFQKMVNSVFQVHRELHLLPDTLQFALGCIIEDIRPSLSSSRAVSSSCALSNTQIYTHLLPSFTAAPHRLRYLCGMARVQLDKSHSLRIRSPSNHFFVYTPHQLESWHPSRDPNLGPELHSEVRKSESTRIFGSQFAELSRAANQIARSSRFVFAEVLGGHSARLHLFRVFDGYQ